MAILDEFTKLRDIQCLHLYQEIFNDFFSNTFISKN